MKVPARTTLLRFSLTTTLFVAAVLCVGLAWFVNAGLLRARALRDLEDAGGEIEYGPAGDTWLTSFGSYAAADGRYLPIRLICFIRRPVTAEVLTRLEAVGRSEGLHFHKCRLALPEVIAVANRLKSSELHFHECDFSDDDLAALHTAKELRELGFTFCNVTDEMLDTIDKDCGIVDLNLNGTRITDRGLRKLSQLRSLEKISTGTEFITAEGVRDFLRRSPQVTFFGAFGVDTDRDEVWRAIEGEFKGVNIIR